MLSIEAAVAANRFGLGARPGDAGRIGGDPRGWLLGQLAPSPAAAGAATPQSATVLAALGELRLARRMQRARRSGRPEGVDGDAVREYRRFVRDAYREQVAGRYAQALATDAPFRERLVRFWSNHFAVSADKQPIAALAGTFEEEAIRPHVTGNFADLLLAAERHPAMLLYLDNAASAGPESPAARAARRRGGREIGLNENLAREILELHTLGVDGGYGQTDVIELAKMLTGWSVGGHAGPRAGGEPGRFHFREALHEPGPKRLLGRTYAESGVEEAEAALRALALHEATARHLATKLARHFVADDPPPALVDRLARAYLESGGALVPVYEALVASPEAWAAPLAKVKTPDDLVVSAYRALDYAPDDLARLVPVLTQLGQRPFTPGSPAGWPDRAASWWGGEALLERIDWAAALGRAVGDRVDPMALARDVLGATASVRTIASVAGAESAAQGIALLLGGPDFQRR
ncbi:MAG TPA: DUF1800 domain-containing protein [Gammaproteobacteria bacterium]